MRHGRRDPGDCLICEAPHCSCGGPGLEVVLVPNRDTVALAPNVTTVTSAPLVSAVVQSTLPPGQFTTGTYRGHQKKP
jgi:hypothetical protein